MMLQGWALCPSRTLTYALQTWRQGRRLHQADTQNNVPSRDLSTVACRKHVGQLLGLDSAHYQDLREI